MEEAILNFANQFSWEPTIVNKDKLVPTDKFAVCGMGGSHLAAGLLKVNNPNLDLLIHRDYDLPRVPGYFLRQGLLIASSYSGNTEETISAFKAAQEAGLPTAVIADRGQLLELAEAAEVPYIDLPNTGIQPRMALGYFCRALALLTDDKLAYDGLGALAGILKPADWRERGEKLAGKLVGRIPLIYSSTVNLPLAYIWKIKFNETGKIPAFYNVFPELNHNEMTGFDRMGGTRNLSDKFFPIFLRDEADDERIQKRMNITADLYADRGLPVEVITLVGGYSWDKIFNSLLLVDWAAYTLARQYEVDPEQVPMVEEFKQKLI
jgi:glucose/mannose-6-phosphate isomerase